MTKKPAFPRTGTGFLLLAAFLVAASDSVSAQHRATEQQEATARGVIMEAYPPEMAAAMAEADRSLMAAIGEVVSVPRYWIVPLYRRWKPGATLIVAFKGGDRALYERIEQAANEWTKPGVANIKFRFKDSAGNYLQWSESDTEHKAHIRISFDERGYWSLLGNMSIAHLLDASLNVGKANQASMNFKDFDKKLPDDWRRTVIHEFGHALGFLHEHQNPIGGCDFRFDDDPGYEKTVTKNGEFVDDHRGRRPGLYTYLSGALNFWSKEQVDINIRSYEPSSAYLGSKFDGRSIMKYYFNDFMFVRGKNSVCYTPPSRELSEFDKEGARKAYPADTNAANQAIKEQQAIVQEMNQSRERNAAKGQPVNQLKNPADVAEGLSGR